MYPARYLVFVVACLATAYSDVLLADECQRLPPSSITIKRLDAVFETSAQFGYRALKGMSADYVRQDIEVLGLTRGQSVAKFQVKSVIQPDPSGRWECASHQVSLEYGFSPMKVYVGKEFPAGTCAYDEIYAHELKHVRTYELHAKTIEQEMSEVLRQRFETSEPVRGARGETQARLNREINERWMPFVTRLLNQVNANQRLVDTPEEYERVASSCGGAIKRQISGKR